MCFLTGALAGAVGEATPRVRLDAPGDSAEEELLVIGSGLLAGDFSSLLLELCRGQVAEAFDLLSDFGLGSHGVNQQSHEGSLSPGSQLARREEWGRAA
jgi:hypothetical protein